MKHILVIEDNEINQDLIKRRLEKRDFRVSVASDGEEGLLMIQEIQPDLVLLDISLPKKDGWEVIKISKSSPTTNQIPIIALTAHAMDEHREKAFELGFDEYEAKPVDMENLLRKITKLIK